MRFPPALCLAVSVVFSLFSGAASMTKIPHPTPVSASSLVRQAASDLCGEVQADLKVLHPTAGQYVTVGTIGTFAPARRETYVSNSYF